FTFAQVDFFRMKQSVAFGKKGEVERGVWQAKPCWLKRSVAFGT
ncbi:hypothetical protein HMPREF9069_00184, partial [Atopobium sp. oral taxon 810 str. F0209]